MTTQYNDENFNNNFNNLNNQDQNFSQNFNDVNNSTNNINNINPYYQNQNQDPEQYNNNPYYNMQSEGNNMNKALVDDFPENNNQGWRKFSEDSEITGKDISTSMRLGFIRKVYGVLSFQLLFTALVSSIGFLDSVREYYQENMFLFWLSFAFSIIVLIPLVCCKQIARKVPINYILLFTFTACESIMLSYLFAAINDWKIVVTAAVITVAVTLALTLYACTTKVDFTFCGGLLFVCIVLMFFLGFFYFLFGTFLRILYCCLGVLVYSIYLIFDTQLVMGKFGNEYNIDDYIIAALNIYLDIIQLFIYILSILGNSRS